MMYLEVSGCNASFPNNITRGREKGGPPGYLPKSHDGPSMSADYRFAVPVGETEGKHLPGQSKPI